MTETALSYLCSITRVFNAPVEAEGVKNISVSFLFLQRIRATRCVKSGGASALLCSWGSFSWMDYLLSFDVSWPHLTGAERRSASALLPSPPPSKEVHLREPGSLRAAPGILQHCVLCIIVLNKHRQHPRRSPLPILPAEGTKLFPLLSSPPNPRLYQLSIKKIQLQFRIRQNTLITKGWCNLITWYLFRGLSRGLTHIERRGGKKQENVGEMSE